MSRRSFDKAFKTAAVKLIKLIIEESFSVKEVSGQLGVYAIVCTVGFKNTKNIG